MDKILLAHGAGGNKTDNLISSLFLKYFGNDTLNELDDSGILANLKSDRFAFTTDTHTITPLFFPGGNIGKLAIAGTVNDLAVCGATPKFLTIGLVIEEGFEMATLERIVRSMAATAREAGVRIVAGDTKVVERGNADGIFINSSGVGPIQNSVKISADRIAPGDKIIINGTMGDHEGCIIAAREGIEMEEMLESDCQPLAALIGKVLDKFGKNIKMMRDPTRGGVATTLIEFSRNAHLQFILDEDQLPIKQQTAAICEIFGYDPLYFANEGKVVIVAAKNIAEQVVQLLRDDGNPDAAIIGEVQEGDGLFIRTRVGGLRPVIKLEGEQLPRIC